MQSVIYLGDAARKPAPPTPAVVVVTITDATVRCVGGTITVEGCFTLTITPKPE